MWTEMSFSRKVFISILGVTLFTIVIAMIPIVMNLSKEYREFALSSAHSQANILADMSVASLLFDQPESAKTMLQSLRESPEILSAAIFKFDESSEKLSLFAYYGGEESAPVFSIAKVDSHQATFYTDYLETVTPIRLQDNIAGYLMLKVSLDRMAQRVKKALMYLSVAILFAVLVSTWLTYMASRSLIKPLQDLRRVTRSIAETQDYSRRARKTSDDELGDLILSFNSMLDVIQEFDRARLDKEREILDLNHNLENAVEERTAELQNSLEKLSATIKDLKDTQRKLVEQEKMASLGGLVAGVAHEINTPIGVAITATSHLSESIDTLNKAFNSGQLTKSAFRESVDDMAETTQMVFKNLERAAAQVRSFKMVAVDQSNEDQRDFNLREYLDNIIMSLRPRLKRTQHVINLDMPDDVTLFSFPGVYSQIFTNLIMNSLIHGFEGMDNGVITIHAELEGKQLRLDYYDNGRGVPEQIRDRIFDPFVTTNRHRGGTGLGTHILYNLITQVLKGRIELLDDTPRGVHFSMVIPLQEPAYVHALS